MFNNDKSSKTKLRLLKEVPSKFNRTIKKSWKQALVLRCIPLEFLFGGSVLVSASCAVAENSAKVN